MRRRACAIALALAAISASRQSDARTVEMAAQLDYRAATGCPSVGFFEAVVTGRLGYDPFRADARDRVILRIETAGRALEGRLEWRSANETPIGEQTFPSRSGDCGELTRAMGFALALQIQLMAATVAETRSAPPTPPPDAAATEARALAPSTPVLPVAQVENATPLATEASTRSSGPSVVIGAGASVGVGISSDPVPLGRLFAMAEWSYVAVELAGEVSVPSTTRRADGAGFSQEQFLVSLVGCGVLSPVSACVVAKGGELRVVGQGVEVPLTASGPMVQTGLRLAASHTFGRHTYISAHAEGLARLTQGTVTLDALPAWTTPRFAAIFGIDVGVRFR